MFSDSATATKLDEASIRPWIAGLLSCPRQVAAVIRGSPGRRAVLIETPLLSAGRPVVDRRAVGLSSSGRRRHPLSFCSSVRCATSTFVSF